MTKLTLEPDPLYDPIKDKKMREFICNEIIAKARKRGWITIKQHELLMFAGRPVPLGTKVVSGSRRNRA